MELQLRLPGNWPVGQHRHTSYQSRPARISNRFWIWLQEVEINAWIQTRARRRGHTQTSGDEDIWNVFHPAEGVWLRGEIPSG